MLDAIDFEANLFALTDDTTAITTDLAEMLVVYDPLAGQAVIAAPLMGSLPRTDWRPVDPDVVGIWQPVPKPL